MKGKSIQKKKSPTPVVLVDDNQQLTNTIIISQMINNTKQNTNGFARSGGNVFSGGFKYRPEHNQSKQGQGRQSMGKDNKSNLLASINLDKKIVYDQFGIINDSIGKKPKYRDPAQRQGQNRAQELFNSNPWRKTPQGHQNNDYQDIIKSKKREQTAVHVKSSLQVINLDNIEAKLEAHRQSMRSIQEQYNIMKGKSTLQQQEKPKLKFNVDVDRQYDQMQPKKVYQIVKEAQKQQQRPAQEVTIQQMWEQRKLNDPRIAQYQFKYQQYKVEKEAKNLIGSVVKDSLFSWDKYAKNEQLQKRKQAKKNKSKEKSYGELVQSKIGIKHSDLTGRQFDIVRNISEGKLANKQSGFLQKTTQNFGKLQQQNTDMQQKIASKDDKFIGKFIMAEIDVDKRGTISKDQLVEYLGSKPHLINGYHIDLKWLHTDLDNYNTKRKGMLNQQEVIQFLATLSKLRHPEMVLSQLPNNNYLSVSNDKNNISAFNDKNSQKPVQNKMYISYFNRHLPSFLKIFQMLDLNEDRLIKREEFIQNIFIDAECSKFIDGDVLKFKLIHKHITYRQILTFILDDYLKERNEKLKKSKQYITFQRFKEYFQVPQNLDLSKLQEGNRERARQKNSSKQIQIYDIDSQYLSILKDIYDMVPRMYQNYIVVNDFINLASRDPQVLALSEEICRIQSLETNLPVETIKSTIGRLTKECDQYANWDTLKTYFSRRGRPVDWDYQLIQAKKSVRQQQLKETSQVVHQKLGPQLQKQLRKTTTAQDLNLIQHNNYTIPQPFDIADERKTKASKTKEIMSSEQKEMEELQKKFRAKPLNKEILESKPDLIQGKTGKSIQKSVTYNYENYQNDRIERVLKKAQEQFEQQEKLKELKKLSEVKAGQIKVDLNKTVKDVMKQKKELIDRKKPKPTVPKAGANLYPQNPKDEQKRKLQKIKNNMDKQNEAIKMKQTLKEQIKDRAKQKNQQTRKIAQEQKKQEEQGRRDRQKLNQNSHKPTINKRELSEAEKQAIRNSKEERQRKKQESIINQLQIEKEKKKKILDYVKKQQKLQIEGLSNEEIIQKFQEVDYEDLLIDQQDKQAFRKEFGFKTKTRKEIMEAYRGLAGRQAAAMQTQQKRLALQRRQLKQKKQSKVIQSSKKAAVEVKAQITSSLNADANFHRSKALRRYRALMENKEPLEEYDQYSAFNKQNEKNDS